MCVDVYKNNGEFICQAGHSNNGSVCLCSDDYGINSIKRILFLRGIEHYEGGKGNSVSFRFSKKYTRKMFVKDLELKNLPGYLK